MDADGPMAARSAKCAVVDASCPLRANSAPCARAVHGERIPGAIDATKIDSFPVPHGSRPTVSWLLTVG